MPPVRFRNVPEPRLSDICLTHYKEFCQSKINQEPEYLFLLNLTNPTDPDTWATRNVPLVSNVPLSDWLFWTMSLCQTQFYMNSPTCLVTRWPSVSPCHRAWEKCSLSDSQNPICQTDGNQSTSLTIQVQSMISCHSSTSQASTRFRRTDVPDFQRCSWEPWCSSQALSLSRGWSWGWPAGTPAAGRIPHAGHLDRLDLTWCSWLVMFLVQFLMFLRDCMNITNLTKTLPRQILKSTVPLVSGMMPCLE